MYTFTKLISLVAILALTQSNWNYISSSSDGIALASPLPVLVNSVDMDKRGLLDNIKAELEADEAKIKAELAADKAKIEAKQQAAKDAKAAKAAAKADANNANFNTDPAAARKRDAAAVANIKAELAADKAKIEAKQQAAKDAKAAKAAAKADANNANFNTDPAAA
jgi:hypothetical protein